MLVSMEHRILNHLAIASGHETNMKLWAQMCYKYSKIIDSKRNEIF